MKRLPGRLAVAMMPLAPRFLVWKVAQRYVAGTTLDDAVATVQQLNAEGAMATIDLLGEEVSDREVPRQVVAEYLRVLAAIDEHGLDSNISIKPTAFGLNLDEAFCRDNIEELVAEAARRGNFVRIDMEDRDTTDATLRIHAELKAKHEGHVGTVLQAYMRRNLADIAALPEGSSIRICKGIYIEPRTTSWKGYQTVRRNYVHSLRALLDRGFYVGIATHDEYLVCEAIAEIRKRGLPPDRYEFQMLLGVDDELRKILIEAGHRLRVYVPYGRDWFLYSARRMRENPEIAGHVIKATLGLGKRR